LLAVYAEISAADERRTQNTTSVTTVAAVVR